MRETQEVRLLALKGCLWRLSETVLQWLGLLVLTKVD